MIEEPTIYIKRLRPDVKLPCYAMPGDAGLDVYTTIPVTVHEDEWSPSTVAMIGNIGGTVSKDRRTIRIPLGFAIEIPDGHFGWLTNKSSRYFQGLEVHGIIDAGYRGEVSAQVRAVEPLRVEAGEKLCQLIIMPVARCQVFEADSLTQTDRGTGGYGSTGL